MVEGQKKKRKKKEKKERKQKKVSTAARSKSERRAATKQNPNGSRTKWTPKTIIDETLLERGPVKMRWRPLSMMVEEMGCGGGESKKGAGGNDLHKRGTVAFVLNAMKKKKKEKKVVLPSVFHVPPTVKGLRGRNCKEHYEYTNSNGRKRWQGEG
jgi:hypothetical protein